MPYYDLYIPTTADTDIKETVHTLIKLGYDGAAFTHITEKQCTDDHSSKVLNRLLIFRDQDFYKSSRQSTLLQTNDNPSSSFRIYTRLNVLVMDQSQQHNISMSNQVIQSYDIIAAVPANDKAMHACIQSENVDIISIDQSQRQSFHIKLTPVKMAIERGIYFEVNYSSSLRDSTARRQFITNVQHQMFLTKGRNVIFTSGAKKALEQRSCQEIANLALSLNCASNKAGTLMSNAAYSVLMHAQTRRTCKGTLQLRIPKDRSVHKDEDVNNRKTKNPKNQKNKEE